MSTPQATGMGFNDYQTYLSAVVTDMGAGNYSGAFLALAQAQGVLAGLPEETLIGAKMTRFRALKELTELRASITAAQIANSAGGGGTGFGLFGFSRTQ